MSNVQEIPLMTAAAKLQQGYSVALRLVLRGEIEGRQNERGRWLVSSTSLNAWRERHRTGAAA